MTAAVRQIRKLDSLPEQKSVRGIVIEKGVPLPIANETRRSPGVEAMLTIEVGESFVHKGRGIMKAKEIMRSGRKFTSRDLGGGRFRIWRIK